MSRQAFPPMRRRIRSRRRWRRALVACLVALAGAWGYGFHRFTMLIPEPGPASQRKTDAIVVLTGGAGRVREGLRLLDAGLGKKLLVSGVHGAVDVRELLRAARQAPGNLECCIVVDHAAGSTRGNARETAGWMRREGYRSLRLVTASYHMPRSLLEFGSALPAGIEITQHPVFPGGFRAGNWLRWRGSGRLVVSEYHKYLAALARRGIAGGR